MHGRRSPRRREAAGRFAFGSERKFRRWQRATGLSDSDVRLEVVAQLAQKAIVRQIDASVDVSDLDREDPANDAIAQERQQIAIDAFADVFRWHWHAATSCAEPYSRLAACSRTPRDSG